ncbi:cobyric acid synthase [Paenibacillus sp. J5C_2022]|uniref:cobyric acid synthase n=1 Tax=Paenibacillus sp. J5C2022 TaxID=2977129 RepID=UPI0021D15113|nr:cobyric acid synthase [Paenibacillus sp. J5C2022]MCU6707222.1 cobyric acid synthase [Paenibacillus sp. J5C2022]
MRAKEWQAESGMAAGRTLMIQGTASDVGKSVVTAALCRIFKQDGYRPAPFKSQNMSLNSYVTADGKEIGRAQAMQADACGITATTDMNPILLKPSGDMRSQVVVHGKPLRDYEAAEYRSQYLPVAGGIVREALQRLRSRHDIVVLEGAGSPAEINLKDRDIVNMQMAEWAEASVILVADIDRGGVFAAIVGTLELLEKKERDRVCGFIINKFRGDLSLLQPGLSWLEERTGKPVLGVLSHLPDLALEDEDSLAIGSQSPSSSKYFEGMQQERLDVVVLRLPRISNFTDMDPLRFEADVSLRYVSSPEQWGNPDAVIVPGSKNTLEDLAWLREQGLESLLLNHKERGGWTVGICGGYEMMGLELSDPQGVESSEGSMTGMGLFPFRILFGEEKTTLQVRGRARITSLHEETDIEGYEIHMGAVEWMKPPEHQPFRIACGKQNERPEGAASPDGRTWGTFLHGIFQNDAFRRQWLNDIRTSKGWAALEGEAIGIPFRRRRETAFDRLAEHARMCLNVPLIYDIAGLRKESSH